MKAMLIKAYGEDAVFEVAEVEKPDVQSGNVLVKIAASSVNTVDTMIRTMGKDLPYYMAEAIMGEVVRELGWPRESFVISTKLYWGLRDGPNSKNTLNRKYLMHAIDGSLERLGMEKSLAMLIIREHLNLLENRNYKMLTRVAGMSFRAGPCTVIEKLPKRPVSISRRNFVELCETLTATDEQANGGQGEAGAELATFHFVFPEEQRVKPVRPSDDDDDEDGGEVLHERFLA